MHQDYACISKCTAIPGKITLQLDAYECCLDNCTAWP